MNPTIVLVMLSPMVAVEDRYMAGLITIALHHLYPPRVKGWPQSVPKGCGVSRLSVVSSIYRWERVE